MRGWRRSREATSGGDAAAAGERARQSRVTALVRQLRNAKPAGRAAIEAELGQLGATAVDQLLVDLARMESTRRRLPLYVVGGLAAWVGLLALAEAAMQAVFGSGAHGAGVASGLSGGVAAALASWKAYRSNAARALARFDDVRAVGPLALAREFGDADTRAAAESALIRLLPRLQPQDGQLLTEAQRAALRRSLSDADASLVLAVLQALTQVGDARDIEAVRHAVREFHGHDGGSRGVQSAAAACLSALEDRAAAEAQAAVLLRHAEGPAAAEERLVRPAQGAGTTPAEQLVRPTDPAR